MSLALNHVFTGVLCASLACRVIMSVNDKWHYCHNSDVLVGSRGMRDRHLQLLGYVILQVRQVVCFQCV